MSSEAKAKYNAAIANFLNVYVTGESTLNFANTRYIGPSGNLDAGTEATREGIAARKGTIKKIIVFIRTNTLDAIVTCSVRKNGAPVGPTGTIGIASTVALIINTNITLEELDRYALELAVAGTAGSMLYKAVFTVFWE